MLGRAGIAPLASRRAFVAMGKGSRAMGTTASMFIGVILFFGTFTLSSPALPQDLPVGMVQTAERAHLGQGPVSAGASIYAGEVLSTDAGGAFELRVASLRFALLENSRASFYPRQTGSVAQLTSGTLTFRRDSGEADIEVVASDVRVVPHGDGPVVGEVTIASPCKIIVTSRLGQLDVTSGKETRTIDEKKSYSVIPVVTVLDVHYPVSPDDSEYHRSHAHKVCAAPPIIASQTGGPLAAGVNHFMQIALVGAGVATGIGIRYALLSPERP
jgi:hypothetical protein